MEKPLSTRTGGALDRIISQNPKPQTQVNINRFTKLTEFIEEQRLTDTLQILENSGLEDNVAIFVLASIQISTLVTNQRGRA